MQPPLIHCNIKFEDEESPKSTILASNQHLLPKVQLQHHHKMSTKSPKI